MSAPNRAAEVAQIVGGVRQLFGSEDGRREILKVICRELNKTDGDNWGLLSKDDRGGFVPADIIVWRPTLEHFDVLTDTGPVWGERGQIPPSWSWKAAEAPSVAPAVPTVPSRRDSTDVLNKLDGLQASITTLSADNQALRQQLNSLESALNELSRRIQTLADRPAPAVTFPEYHADLLGRPVILRPR
jgi:hypothetical protein